MTSARRRAEEALARLDRWDANYRPRTVEIDADDLRSLLADAPPSPAPDEVREAAEAWREATQLVVFVPARLSRALHALSALAARGATASPAPKSDEVREAAERVEAALPAVRRYQRVPLPLSSDHAAMAPGTCECRWHATDGLLWSVDSLLAALAARGGAG